MNILKLEIKNIYAEKDMLNIKIKKLTKEI